MFQNIIAEFILRKLAQIMMKSAVITGTSTGIGYDAARYLIANDFHVFGSVRKEADGARIRAELSDQFTPLVFDVTDSEAIKKSVSIVREKLDGHTLTGLVNNAGIAVAGPLMHIDLDAFKFQFDVNLHGVLAVSQAFLPLLGAKTDNLISIAQSTNPQPPQGRIVNISSVSGKLAYPFLGPYAASKHALEAMSRAMRRELQIYDIDVIVIGPGSIKTPIWDKGVQADLSQYAHTDYADILPTYQQEVAKMGKAGMPVEVVGKTIFKALTADNPRARYALPNNWLTGWIAPRLMPQRWLDKVIGKSLGLTK